MPEQAKWAFRKFVPGDNLSDPDFAKALFSGDQEASLSRSLVREAIQNSLDAKRNDAPNVVVRITMRTSAESVRAGSAAPFTLGIWEHVKSASSGLDSRPEPVGPLPCLIFEDFGTHGLRGDPEHWQPINVQGNGFFLFFRALGRSGKADEDRGRWGVGKFVFPMASRAHTIWGLSVPSDTGIPLLMGRAVLATHEVGQDSYHPDGHWGVRRTNGSNLVSPISDAEVVNRFIDVFGLSRGREPGLSIVVPWLLDEITPTDISEAVVGEYFLPLLRGELKVVVKHSGGEEVLNAAAVKRYATTSTSQLLRCRLALAQRIADGDVLEIEWPHRFTYQETEWESDAVPDALLERLRLHLEGGGALTVHLRTTVRRKGASQFLEGRFSVHVQHAEGLGPARPLIIREGISVSLDKTKSLHDHVAIITADDGPLATLIGDAETPAHEELKHNLVKDKYVLPKKTIVFVREAPSQLLKTIWEADQQDDPLLLATFFPLQSEDGRTGDRPETRRQGPVPEPRPKPEIPSAPPRFRVSRIEGGFRVRNNPETDTKVEELSVIVAYDVRRGSPFKRYRKYDFDLAAEPIVTTAQGCELVEVESNRFVLRAVDDQFMCEVTGFDARRDLIVRVTSPGASR